MSDGDLVETLADRGFGKVENVGLPGGWATDGEWPVCIQSRSTGLGGVDRKVVVYNESPESISIRIEPAAWAFDSSHRRAIRTALERAGYEEDRDQDKDQEQERDRHQDKDQEASGDA